MNSKKYFVCENCGFEDIVDEFGYCPVCNPEQLSDEEKEAEEDNGSKGHCYFLGVMEGKCRLDKTVCEYCIHNNYEDCPKLIGDKD